MFSVTVVSYLSVHAAVRRATAADSGVGVAAGVRIIHVVYDNRNNSAATYIAKVRRSRSVYEKIT